MNAAKKPSIWLAAAVLLFPLIWERARAFSTTTTRISRQQWSTTTTLQQGRNANDDDDSSVDSNPLTKASWYAAEAFGKVFGAKSQQPVDDDVTATTTTIEYDLTQPPATAQETLDRLQQDNEREYFLSGTVDTLIYDPNCEFADPFVSFKGRDRFVENLANLGSFITKYSAKPLSYVINSDSSSVDTKFMVKLELNLPWKPVLAWPWGVTCQIDPRTNLIVLHQESWDIEAWEGVKQVFRKPTTTVN